jgi:hypothetical protein
MRSLLAIVVLLLLAPTAHAGEITAFVGFPSPRETWGRSYGATLTTTWFKAIALEGEAVRVRGDDVDDNMTTFSGTALLAPSIGLVTPFGGFGVGIFRQTSGTRSDNGILHAFVLGAKLRLGLVVLRGEYRQLELGDAPLLPMDKRLSFGAGLSF